MLSEIGVTKSKIIRAIESVRASGKEISPQAIAETLEIPPKFLYSDFDLLEEIYNSAGSFLGPDAIINKLYSEREAYKSELENAQKEIKNLKREKEKSYSEGFSFGASVNYKDHQNDKNLKIQELETWAKGMLFLDLEKDLNEDLIKKAYRRLIMLLHPDKTGEEGESLAKQLNTAYEVLIKKYQS